MPEVPARCRTAEFCATAATAPFVWGQSLPKWAVLLN